MSDEAPHTTTSPVMTVKQAARYVQRTPNALRILRHRRRGPRSFKRDGLILYFVADLDAWLHQGAQDDSRFNPDRDPTQIPPQQRDKNVA